MQLMIKDSIHFLAAGILNLQFTCTGRAVIHVFVQSFLIVGKPILYCASSSVYIILHFICSCVYNKPTVNTTTYNNATDDEAP